MPIHAAHPLSGFRRLFHTHDFSEWEAGIKRQLGLHQSHLLSNADSFQVRCDAATVGPLHILHVQGNGELELNRTQLGSGVLWLPLKGVSEERINGRVVQARRGQAILMRPNDHLYGLTSVEMCGLSVILPERFFLEADRKDQESCPRRRRAPDPLLRSETGGAQAVIRLAMELSRAVARRDACSPLLAAQLLDQLEQILLTTTTVRQSLGARRRWEVVRASSHWMEAHLAEPFRIGDVAAATQTPTRTIQQAFAEEMGRSPLAQAKLLRLHALRRSLQDPEQKQQTIATQMAACGLPASGETALAYRACFGERPSQTKQN